MEWGNFKNWWSGGTKDREMGSTRVAWEEVEGLWHSSPLGKDNWHDRVTAFLSRAFHTHHRTPAFPVLYELCMALDRCIRSEEIGSYEITWPIIENDVVSAVHLRQMTIRRRRWVSDFDGMFGKVEDAFLDLYRDITPHMPDACFGEWKAEEDAFSVPLVELVENPAWFVQRLLQTSCTDETMRLDMLLKVRKTIERNLLIASNLHPDLSAVEVEAKLVFPEAKKGLSPTELAELYLKGTPFLPLALLPVPFTIPEEVRFEHGHIVGGTGHGKTQLLQRMIYGDLVAAREDGRSVVVIDSQGDLINKLLRLDLFDHETPGSLYHRLVLIDPTDVEFPAALNLFDAQLDRLKDYRPADKERVLNGVVELYETFFGELLGAELTQKQGVIFKYLARLMLVIPNANIHTLMQLMENPKPYLQHMAKLDGSARHFFATEFFTPAFAQTKKQILRRLWGVLSTPAFERMFAQRQNKLDLFQALQDGKIILVSTAKDLLKEEGSRLFGRFFIAMLTQAALERSTIPVEERTPTFVYVDEAQEYFDDNIETILNQARKYRLSICCAHQALDQLSPRLRSVLFSNTSLKCVGGVSAKDARSLDDELHTTADFIESMKRRNGRSEFAVWLKHHTPSAIRLSVPLGYVEQKPILSEEAYAVLLERNRTRYCGTLADVSEFEIPKTESLEPEPPRRQRSEPLPAEREPPIEPVATPSVERVPRSPRRPESQELGKGGPQHIYAQKLIQNFAQDRGFRATIEAPVEGGSIDVVLRKEDISIACEISVSSTADHEVQNLAKCLKGDFTRIFAVANDTRRLKALRTKAIERLAASDLERIDFLTVDQVLAALAMFDPPPPEENIVRGYKVKVSHKVVSPSESEERRATVARIISQSMKGLKED